MIRQVFVKKCAALLVSTFIIALASGATPTAATSDLHEGPIDSREVETFVDGVLGSQMHIQNVAGAVVAVVKDGKLLFAKGYGYADMATRTPVDADKTLFRIGSISKLFTWTALMQLAEQDKLRLDVDVNTYLDFKIPDTYPGQPITLAHLMSHSGGFEDRAFGLLAPNAEALVSLGVWLRNNIPARVRPPGAFSAYSNYGATLAGYIVERVSGMPYDDYVEKFILQPLKMNQTTSRQPLPSNLTPYMSNGYEFANGAFKPQPFLVLNTPPAGSFSASATDVAKFMIAHLQNGEYDGVRILSEASAMRMQTRLFGHDDQLNGFAYGFIEDSRNGQRVIGHGGDIGAFHSLLALIPSRKLGLYISYNTTAGVMQAEVPYRAFMDHYFPAQPSAPVQPTPQAMTQPTNLTRLAGEYRLNRASYTTAEKVESAFAVVRVAVANGDGLVMSSPLGVWHLVEERPLLFRTDDGMERVLFRADVQGNITYVMVNSLPTLVGERYNGLDTVSTQGVLLAAALLLLMSTLIAAPAGSYLVRRLARAGAPVAHARAAGWARWLQVLMAVLAFVYVVSMAAYFMGDGVQAVMRGDGSVLALLSSLPVLFAALAIGALVFTVIAWKNRYWGVAGRLHYTLVTFAAGVFLWVLNYWNLLGWRI